MSYASKILGPTQRKYCTTRKELLAVIVFTRQFRHYLLGRSFTIRTDHHSLVWLMRFRNLEGQLARWLEELSQYDFQLIHRPGRLHGNADGLSRQTSYVDLCDCYRAGCKLSELPCGGCSYCTRVQNQWSQFEEEVDDVLPLSVRHVAVDADLDDDEDEPVPPDPDTVVTSTSPFATYEPHELSQLQSEDQDLTPILQWISSLLSPVDLVPFSGEVKYLLARQPDWSVPEEELAISSPATKYYWTLQQQLQLISGVLYYQWELDTGSVMKLIVPKLCQEEVIRLCHDIKSAGHFGRHNTTERVGRKFHWYRLRRDVELYVNTCRPCNMNKKANRRRQAGMKSYHAGMALERVHVDITGPFVESKKGNKLILVVVDQFTKWFECYAIPDQTAEVVCRALVDNFISRFGIPQIIHTDQGRNFESSLFREMCKLLEIAKTRTTPYRPSSNGQIERYNRILLAVIRCFIEDQQEWDEHLPLLSMAIRSTVNRSTGCTPNQLMLGREVSVPDEIFGMSSLNSPKQPVPDYLRRLLEHMKAAHAAARKQLQSVQLRQREYYDKKVREQRYQLGDMVYKLDSTTQVGVTAKLKPVYDGPYLIIQVISSLLYRIAGRRRTQVLHHDRLRPCIDREVPLWIRRKRHQLLSIANLHDPMENPLSSEGEVLTGGDEEPEDILGDTIVGETLKDEPESVKPRNNVSAVVDINESDQNDVQIVNQDIPRQSRAGRQIRWPSHLSDFV